MNELADERRLSLKRLWVLMVTAFVDMVGFALLLPLVPLYATRFGADAFTVGLLMAAFAFAQMAARRAPARPSESRPHSGTALLFPSTTSLVSRNADPKEMGQTLGVQQAFGGMSRLLGPIWGGAVFQQLGQGVPFWMAGGLVLATALFALRLHPGEASRHSGA